MVFSMPPAGPGEGSDTEPVDWAGGIYDEIAEETQVLPKPARCRDALLDYAQGLSEESMLELSAILAMTQTHVRKALEDVDCLILTREEGAAAWVTQGGNAPVASAPEVLTAWAALADHIHHVGRPAIFADLRSESRFYNAYVLYESLEIVSLACVPFPGVGSARHVLNVVSRKPRLFDYDDMAFLQMLVRLLEGVLAKRTLLAELEKTSCEVIAARAACQSFLSMVSFQVKTAFNGIAGTVDLLADTELDTEQRQYLNIINQSSGGFLQIIGNIYDYLALEAGTLTLETSPVDVRTLLRGVAEEKNETNRASNRVCIVQFTENMPLQALADAQRLRQTVSNVLDIALGLLREGTVRLLVEVSGEGTASLEGWTPCTLCLSFTCSGEFLPGFSTEKMTQLLERQGDFTSLLTQGENTLGLIVASRLFQLMGGELTVHYAPGLPAPGNHLPTPCITFRCRLGLQARFSKVHPEPAGLQDRTNDILMPETGQPFILLVLDAEESCRQMEVRYREQGASWIVPTTLQSLSLNLVGSEEHPFDMVLAEDDLIEGVMDTLLEWERGNGLDIPVLALPRGWVDGNFDELPRNFDEETEPSWWRALPLEEPEAIPHAIPGRPERILLVEDNPVNQRTILHYLEKLGFKPHAAANGYQAMEMLEMLPYDLILLDVKMPGMDGFALVERIRDGDSPNRETPIVAITADDMTTSREKCLHAGMEGYLPKPFNMRDIQSVTQEWLKPPSMGGEWT